MSNQPVPLVVVLPLVAAIAVSALGFRGRRGGWEVASAALVVEVGLVALLLESVAESGPLTYPLGGIPRPYGIEFVVDGLGVVLLGVNAVIGLASLLYLRGSGRSNHFYGVFLVLTAGIAGVGVTGDLFTMYVFFEITGIAAYALVATGGTGRAVYAAFKYLVVGTLGASFFLLGIGYVYVATGTLNMADAAARLADVGYASPLVVAAFVFVSVGLAIKIPLVPFHSWLPDAHSEAPAPVSAVISAAVTAAAAFALARVSFGVFTGGFFEATPLAGTAVVTLAGLGVLAGTIYATRQATVKRMLAYSTISQFGLIVAGIGLGTPIALTGAFVHLAGHAVMKAGLFLAAGIFASRFAASTVDDFAGLSKRAPVLSAAFVAMALAMTGIPPGIGFFGKWYLALGAIEARAWPIAAVVLLSTLLTLGYFIRVFERLYLAPGALPDGGTSARGAPGSERLRLGLVVVFAIGSIAIGLGSARLVDLIAPAVEALLVP